MATADRVLNEPSKLNLHVEYMEGIKGISKVFEAVQKCLNSWSKERIASLQKIDGGWAPFDERGQPLQVSCAAAVHCNRDAIHRQCIALREAGIPLTPELVELDEFFCTASKIIEGFEEHGRSTPDTRTPPTPTHRNAFVNW